MPVENIIPAATVAQPATSLPNINVSITIYKPYKKANAETTKPIRDINLNGRWENEVMPTSANSKRLP